jgi:hypothetical protein
VETKLALVILFVVISSGCVDQLGDGGEEQMPNRGLEIQDFSITDNTLRPQQNAIIRASFKNYHRYIDVNEVSIFNEGPHLDVQSRGCTPSTEDLEGARQGLYPEMECVWEVTAPEESEIDGFRERTEPVKLRLSYNGSLTNQRALAVSFQDIADIENTTVTSRSFSNGEISASMTTESPVAFTSGNSVELTVQNDGTGRIEGPYRFEYTPGNVFENCPSQEAPLVGSEWRQICDLSAESTGTRNLFFTTYYKYVKEPNLDITIVNRG